MHHADIAEILDELDFDGQPILGLRFRENSEILLELEDDLRENILKRLSAKRDCRRAR
jgi:magnesium transporter